MITVRFYTTLRQATGTKSAAFECQPGCTLRGLIDLASVEYPGLAKEIYDDGGDLRGHIRIFVNSRDQSYQLQLLEIGLEDEDQVDIFAAVSGGDQPVLVRD